MRLLRGGVVGFLLFFWGSLFFRGLISRRIGGVEEGDG